MPDRYMTVREFVEECLRGELTVERLKAYGNELDGFRQEYSETRGTTGYRHEITKELIDLVGYLRAGLPERIKDEELDFFGKTPEEALRQFVKKNISPEALSFRIRRQSNP